MNSIVSYQKVSTPYTTIQMQLPDSTGVNGEFYCTELCELAGVTYVAVPAGVVLPNQAPELTITPVVLTDVLREQIKAASPHVSLISERMVQKIRASYTIDDEMFFARIGVGAALGLYTPTAAEQSDMQNFGLFVESVRQWGRDQRALLGL